MKVAVVGAGIAGLGAARALVSAGHEVVLYDAAARPGGHVHTVDVDGREARPGSAGPRSGAQRGEVSIDMGFIVCNRERYPLFFAMLAELGVKTRPTTMTFSVALPERELEWSTASLFAQRRRVLDRAHWRFLVDVLTFLRRARRDLELGRVTGTLDDYVQGELRDAFAVPLAASLWSLAPDRCGDFPAETFVRFLDQHGMLRAVRPLAWHTIEGGSQRYVEALVAALRRGRFELRLGTPVERITRLTGITVVAGERQDRYDRVIIATHANTALSLLDDATPDERRVLGAFGYSTNRTVLHTDRSFLPRAPSAHAAWNYVADPQSAKVAVTYSMTRLQGLPDAPYLVTLNPRTEPRGILHEVMFAHPQLDAGALAAQSELPRLANTRRTYYAGAYFGFGFHEDGLRAGLAAAARCMADGARE